MRDGIPQIGTGSASGVIQAERKTLPALRACGRLLWFFSGGQSWRIIERSRTSEPFGSSHQPFQLSFNPALRVEFQGSRVTSNGGLSGRRLKVF